MATELFSNIEFDDTSWWNLMDGEGGSTVIGTGQCIFSGSSSWDNVLGSEVGTDIGLVNGTTYVLRGEMSGWISGDLIGKLGSTGSGAAVFPTINSNGLFELEAVYGAEGFDRFIFYTNTSPINARLENLSLQEKVATTTVEIEWIDSLSAAVIGHKVYRDTVPSTGEVELADVGLGVQFYADATALPGTEYKYEVQAYSSTFETISEQVTINVRTITTAS